MKPRFLFIHAASECNLSCLHCLFWRSHTKDDPNRLSVEKIADIIGEFSELSPQGKVVICGGEPMLEYDRYMGICQAARSVGLRVFTATNGYPIHYAKRAADLLLNGPHEITVSLDSHDSQIHDRIRNRPGSFDTAVRAIRLLVEARRSLDINCYLLTPSYPLHSGPQALASRQAQNKRSSTFLRCPRGAATKRRVLRLLLPSRPRCAAITTHSVQ
jgi:MoaA/NifB/PqqE/SkfB family radical SAM enzyme